MVGPPIPAAVGTRELEGMSLIGLYEPQGEIMHDDHKFAQYVQNLPYNLRGDVSDQIANMVENVRRRTTTTSKNQAVAEHFLGTTGPATPSDSVVMTPDLTCLVEELRHRGPRVTVDGNIQQILARVRRANV